MFVCVMYVCEYGNVCGGQRTTSRTWFLSFHCGSEDHTQVVYTVSVCISTELPLWLAPFLIIIIQVGVPQVTWNLWTILKHICVCVYLLVKTVSMSV